MAASGAPVKLHPPAVATASGGRALFIMETTNKRMIDSRRAAFCVRASRSSIVRGSIKTCCCVYAPLSN